MEGEEFPAYTFADPDGRRWVLVLNNGLRKRLKNECGIDISAMVEKNLEPLLPVDADNDKLLEVVWVLAEDQAARHGVTRETFGDSFTGETYDAARGAFYEAVALFFPPRFRQVIRKMLALCEGMATKVGAIEMERLTKELESMSAAEIVEQLTAKAGDLQAS